MPQPEYVDQLAFVRSRPQQPLDPFIRQSNVVTAHDALGQLGKITAPTQVTFGRHDIVMPTRFAMRSRTASGTANSSCSRPAPTPRSMKA
jgi:pimeloyl-ACP methyl ester carboxylesterase